MRGFTGNLLFLTVVCSSLITQSACTNAEIGNANLSREVLVFDGMERSYYLHLPPDYQTARKFPVVLVLHGGGRADGNELAKYTSFDEMADREGFIAVYPNGVDAQWSDGRGETYRKADNTGMDDVGFISALIDRLVRDHNGDPARIYVTGLSNGGLMSLRLGCELSARLAAIGPAMANMPKNIIAQCAPDAPLPVLLMNGTEDPLVPWNGGHVRLFRRTMGEVVSTADTMDFWVQHNRCDPAPKVEALPDRDGSDGSTVEVSTYANCENGGEVILYGIRGGGHALPGSDIPEHRLAGRKNKDIDGAAVIWAFFKEHSR